MPNSFYTLQVIDPTECMGDSVYKIRNNDFNASEAIGSIETLIASVSALITTQYTTVVQTAVPVGVVQSFARITAPSGWLICNGDAIGTTGTIQGVAASSLVSLRNMFLADSNPFGTTSGNPLLPDLRGEFIRGWAGTRAVDTGRVFGSNQADEFKSHTHPFVEQGSSFRSVFNVTGGTGMDGAYDISRNTSATGGSETRPRNVALLYCIKY
jgi:phage-related tail fiber protein